MPIDTRNRVAVKEKVILKSSATQTIALAADRILANAPTVVISNTTGASITLSNSSAVIVAGADDEVIKIINIGADNVVIPVGGSTNIAATGSITLAANGFAWFQYLPAISKWQRVG